VDVLFPQSDFTPYKIIVAPSLFVLDKPLADKLTRFASNGGTLILTYRSGVKDEHNVVTDLTLPGPLAELAGVAIHDFDPQINQEQSVVTTDGTSISAHTWFDILDPTTADTVLTYGKGYYAGKAALTRNRVGNGLVYYVGTDLAQEYYIQGIKAAAEHVGISLGPSIPEGVEVAVREKEGMKILFLLNYTDQPQKVSLGQSGHNALSGEAEPEEVQLAPFEVKVLTTP